MHGLEIRPERGAVPPVRATQARPHVEQRDVVVPWHGQHGHAQAVCEGTSGAELRRSSPLRDVAGQHDQFGPLLACQFGQCIDDGRLLGAEVRIGDLQQDGHPPASPSRGASR